MPLIEIFLIILGAVVIGTILSVGIIYLLRRIEKPRYPKKKYIIPSPQSSVAPPKTNGASVAPKNGSKGDKLEELLKNHKKVESPPLVKQPNPAAVKQPVAAHSSLPRSVPAVSPSAMKQPTLVASPTVSQTATAVQQATAIAAQPTVVAPKPAAEKPKVQLPKSDVYKELESNLNVATAPWSGKVTAFQTTAWDANPDKIEPGLAEKRAEITEVYIDIRLANNIVWISNELGNKSPNLDESYRKLCTKIAERIGNLVAPVNSKPVSQP